MSRSSLARSCPVPSAVLRFLVLACIMVGLVGTGVPVSAQGNPAAASATRIAEAEVEVRAVDRALDSKVDDDDRRELRDRAQGAKDSTDQAVSDLTEQLALVNARITGLGTPTPGEAEAPELVAQRKALSLLRSTIDAAIKRGRLAGVEAGQLVDEIDQSKAAQFNEKLSSKTPSPLSPPSGPSCWNRPARLAAGRAVPETGRRTDCAAMARRHPVAGAAGLCAGGHPDRPGTARWAPAGAAPPDRRGPAQPGAALGYTFWRVAVGTLCPLAAAFVFVQGLRWAGLLPQRWTSFLDGFVFASGVAGFTAAVTGAVLMRSQPSWRIAPLDNETAQRLRPLSWG